MKTYWSPHEKQVEALQSTCFETLYGGARGGGKTDAGMAWLLYDIENPSLRQLVIRRNYEDLKDWIDRAHSFYRPNGATFKLSSKEIEFPSGAKILLGHLKDDGAYTKYQGHEYHRMLIEELTHIPTEELYLKLISSCRSTVPGLEPRVFATTNPGEVGHRWVKKRFVDSVAPGTPMTDHKTGRKRVFVQAKVQDNPTLMERDPGYLKFLDGLPDGLREQWKDGSWDDIEIKGAYYTKVINQARDEMRLCRVEYEPSIPVDTFWDLGINDETAIWFTQRYGREIRVIDCWVDADVSLLEWLSKIRESNYKNLGDFYYPHDVSVREYTTGEQRITTIEKYGKDMGFKARVQPRTHPEDRVHATRMLFNRMYIDVVRCETGLDALRNYRKEYDERNLTYKDKPVHDWASHAADAFGMIGLAYKMKEAEPEKFPHTSHARDPEGWEDIMDEYDPRDKFCPF